MKNEKLRKLEKTSPVIPAKAGIHSCQRSMLKMDSPVKPGNDELGTFTAPCYRAKLSLFTIHCSLFTKRGFTLLEVMISIAIVGGLLVTLIYTLNYHLGIADRHSVITVSMNLAKEKMYEMEKSPASRKGQFPEPYAGFSYETGVKDSLFPGFSEISVVIREGKEEIKLSELIRKKSL